MTDPSRADRPDFVGVVVAAGSASRFGGRLPKQFADLAGVPLLRHAVTGLARRPAVGGVVVVLAPHEVDSDRGRTAREWPGVLAVVAGGASRAESVRLGVAAASPAEYVLVHDAARPLASPRLIDAVIAATREHGASIPGLPVADTVKRVRDGVFVEETVDRAELCLAQTPQGARREWLEQALDAASGHPETITDEASALEQAGRRVAIVSGETSNRKITTQEDLDDARRRLEPGAGLRVGSGFDIHRFGGEDRTLVLGGITFEDEPGLVGHSDADVVLHAAMDALLGAAALGDIGALFPPDDPRFEGADSRQLAGEVARRLDEAGYRVVNLDLTLLAERPKIRRRADAMREAIATSFGLRVDQVGLKATTLEKLGSLGRAEGAACEAVALVQRVGEP